jgi:CRP-like cAMP-binding protein
MDKIYTNNQSLVLAGINQYSQLVKKQKKVFFKKGANPLNTLNTSKYFYFILSGKIKIFQIDFNSSKEQTLYLLSRGDMFDVVSLLDGTKREQLSEVLEDSELIQMPIEDVKVMILQDNNFRQLFYSYLASQLKSMEDLAISLSFYDVYQRVLQLFSKFTYIQDGKPILAIVDNLKNEDIASMVGTVRKVVNRSLQKLKKDGVIELSRKNIQIANFQKLLDRLDV